MKEIDFLPEWYKSGRQRKISVRSQYIALGCIFVAMMVWNFIASRSVSKAAAELAQTESKQAEAESISREFAMVKDEVAQLQRKADVMKEIDSKIDVAGVLAEMSFLIDEKIVLGRVEFDAERFVDKQARRAGGGSGVRAAGSRFAKKQAPSLGDVRFKVVISGVAADASYVAKLICELEDSPYFCLVYPSFSRNTRVKAGTSFAGKNYQVSEFEIGSYLANYRELRIKN